jgi:hypothetical protein
LVFGFGVFNYKIIKIAIGANGGEVFDQRTIIAAIVGLPAEIILFLLLWNLSRVAFEAASMVADIADASLYSVGRE